MYLIFSYYVEFSDALLLCRYIEWKELENNMDALISKIKQIGTSFDAVIEIKSDVQYYQNILLIN
jgi:hypothetical protein